MSEDIRDNYEYDGKTPLERCRNCKYYAVVNSNEVPCVNCSHINYIGKYVSYIHANEKKKG